MTTLMWDQVGERRFETGVDRGVLFLADGRAVAWNGLTGLDDNTTQDVQSHYLDGTKFLERHIPGDFTASLKAYTYPEEFNEVLGIAEVHPGLSYHGQNPKMFNLVYRTRLGNDLDGVDYGYKIHILYNVMAVPGSESFASVNDSIQPSEFSWTLTSVPPHIDGYRPTTHLSIDSTKTDPLRLRAMENLLYGTDTTDPALPPIDVITTLFDLYESLIIIDNGDGTWTGADLAGDYITLLDSETFEIAGADATMLDADTYTLSTTTP